MCTAYELGKRGGSFPERVKARSVAELLALMGASIVRPTLAAPVILPDGDLETMSWGFRRAFAPKVKGRKPVMRTIVNSREDKLAGRMWQDAFNHRRCLIPAAAFFEWVEKDGRNVPLRFQRPGDDWLWIAGIWEDSDTHGRCFSMITTEPTAAIAPVHDRMPAVLDDARIGPWLDGDLQALGPSPVPLDFHEAPNFLKPPPAQGELF